ncbi:MAG: hypothetical protein IJH87_06270 [Atopobiaceae bacterium]|nr:hypothetical protein [Atopobiaceae bacterium]
MALIQVSMLSDALQRTVPLRVVTPADKLVAGGYANPVGKKYKMLLLLHGYHGSFVDWTNATRIQKWAETYNFIVVMPSGENSSYIPQVGPENDFGHYIGVEIPRIMRTMFPISERWEDMWIAGLSMGGFGAMRNGLKYNETFSRIMALSGGFSRFLTLEANPDDPGFVRFVKQFGGLENARNTDLNPSWRAKQLMDAHKADPSVKIPKIYMSCGTEDDLFGANILMRDSLREMGYEVDWYEGPGTHAWTFWGPEMLKLIQTWLPLDDSQEGIDSGHTRGTAAREEK